MDKRPANGNLAFYKEFIQKSLGRGHKRKKSDFKLEVAEYPVLSDLVLSVEIPQLKREELEEFAPFAGKVMSQGRPELGGTVPISFQEVVGGPVHRAIRNWVKKNQALDVVIKMVGELEPSSRDQFTLIGCQIALDGTEVSYEDGTPIRFSGSLYFWYVDEFLSAAEA